MATNLADVARHIRISCVEIAHATGIAHLGADFSALEAMLVVYSRILRSPDGSAVHPERDRFILSKGHAALAYYHVLAHAGFLRDDIATTYLRYNSALGAHPSSTRVAGVETSTGPLGHGLPFAVGSALASRLSGVDYRTIVLVGDGELQEGSNWEAAMLAGSRKLDSLLTIVDRNMLQQGRPTEVVNQLEPLADRWRAFGWAVRSVDGHDLEALTDALSDFPFEVARPSCLIAHTVKGKGVSFMENVATWHHKVPSKAHLDQARLELAI